MEATKKERDKIRKIISKWKCILFLHQWKVDFVFHNDTERKGLLITMQTEYKNALIEINIDSWRDWDDEDQESILVHELCHAIIQPLIWLVCDASEGRQVTQAEIDWHKETITQHIARAIFYK